MKENPRATIVADFKERLVNAKVAVVADYKGLTVSELEGFRRDLRDNGAQLKVVKNTLAKRALAESELSGGETILKGQVAFVLGYDDAVSGPRTAKGFAKKHKQFRILAGIFEGNWVGPEVIEQLAVMPNKETLRATLLMLLRGPQIKFLSLMKAVPQELVGTLQALAKKKEESAPTQDGTGD